MRVHLPRGFWVKLSLVAAVIWLVRSLYAIPDFQGRFEDHIYLGAVSVLVAVAIVIFGLVLQWADGYIKGRKMRRRRDDR